MHVLTRAEVRRLVPMPDAIELMKTAFAELSAGRAASPLRTGISVELDRADALFMPAHVPALNALGVKIVSVMRDNPSRDLPVIQALVCLIDPTTGRPLAVMDGAYLTALRTGAVSGAATDLLARHDSHTLAVIGPGAQGVTQAVAVCAVRPIMKIIVIGRSTESLDAFQSAISRDWPDLESRLELTTDPSLVRQADVICTATTSSVPVFDDADLQPGTHINAVGAFKPEMQEVPASTVARATVVVDAVEAALAEAGDLIIPLRDGLIARDHLTRELGMVAAGTAPGRISAEEVTLFKSVGNAVQDVAVARLAVDRAIAAGAGTTVDLGR